MRLRSHLQFRVALFFAVFGAIVSLLLSIGLYVATHDMERRLVDETLSAELQDYIARRQRNPASPPLATTTLHGYLATEDTALAKLPAPLRHLAPGRHDIAFAGHAYRVEMRRVGAARYYLLYDKTPFARRQRYILGFLAAGVLVMALVSAAGGRWLAQRVVAPVGELARQVRKLRPEDRPPPLARQHPLDEVGELALAFDHYLTRLQGFIERERAFTADVSHELRTPLAVISGAAEVLLADARLPEPLRPRVGRIRRAADEMAELTPALLTLAREDATGASGTSCAVDEVLRQVVDAHLHLIKDKPVELDLDLRARLELPVAPVLLRIVLGNIVRNAFTYTHHGLISIRLANGELVVEDTGVGIQRDELGRVFQRYYTGQESQGSGIGLALVKRICDRYGWTVTLESEAQQGTTTRMRFGPAQPAIITES